LRLSLKRTLDYHLGRPLLATLNVSARVLGSVLRRSHRRDPVRTILVAKFQGIGSLVSAKPAIAALRRSHPGAHIIFFGTPAVEQLARLMPEFDEILILDDRSLMAAVRSTIGALSRLWREPVDWAFDLEVYSRLSSVLITLSLARNRTGFVIEQLRSRKVHTHLVYFNRYRHLGEAYARLFGQVLPPDESIDVSAYGEWRCELGRLPQLESPYILINVHAGDLALERRWPLEHFRELTNRLLELRPDASAVFIGHGANEVDYVRQIAQGDKVIDLSGKLTLSETIRAIAGADLVVTNDSAPLHFALSMGVNVVGLFGPTLAASYLPPNQRGVEAAQISIYCSPCVHHWEPAPCLGDNQCMKRLSPEMVLSKCRKLLGLPDDVAISGERAVAPAPSAYYPGLVHLRSRRHGQE
jgi:ADP-heptose:LPS heptosyltransferase